MGGKDVSRKGVKIEPPSPWMARKICQVSKGNGNRIKKLEALAVSD